MKRQRGRNRNKSNNNTNRSMDSNGPDVKVRGSASTIYEKYTTLARDAMSSGQRVKAENYLQHAEHYLRVMNIQEAAKQAAQEEREAARAARTEAGEEDEDSDNDNRGRRNNRKRRERSEDGESETPDNTEGNGKDSEPAELDVIEAKDDALKRRRRAPSRKSSDSKVETEAVDAAE